MPSFNGGWVWVGLKFSRQSTLITGLYIHLNIFSVVRRDDQKISCWLHTYHKNKSESVFTFICNDSKYVKYLNEILFIAIIPFGRQSVNYKRTAELHSVLPYPNDIKLFASQPTEYVHNITRYVVMQGPGNKSISNELDKWQQASGNKLIRF